MELDFNGVATEGVPSTSTESASSQRAKSFMYNRPSTPSTMGLLRRGFSSSDTMIAVYDWVGSQTTEPQYFELRFTSVKCLSPTTPVTEVDGRILYMAECAVPPSICGEAEHKTVQFRGFGQLLNCSATTEENF